MRKITLEEHKKFGELCKEINFLLVQLSKDKFNSVKTKAAGKKLTTHEFKALKLLWNFRFEMSLLIFNDYPEIRPHELEYYCGDPKRIKELTSKTSLMIKE